MPNILRRLRTFALALGVLGGFGACGGGEDEPLDPQQMQRIDAAVANGLAAYGGSTAVPGAMVVVYMPGKQALVKGYGKADLSSGRMVAAEDKFRVGSNTRTRDITKVLYPLIAGVTGSD